MTAWEKRVLAAARKYRDARRRLTERREDLTYYAAGEALLNAAEDKPKRRGAK